MQNPYSARIKGVQMKKYKIIYADPPWRYARSKVQGAAEKHYPTMSIEELCALPVKEIADKDCILFLWATFPQLKEALQLIKAWGFTYKSVAFVWLKQNRKVILSRLVDTFSSRILYPMLLLSGNHNIAVV